jgi:HTH-type transcriptional regulator, competence development regulator
MLSDRLKIARKMKKLTQEELAEKVKATKGTISNYENEHSSPSPEMLNDLADALAVSADFLLGRTDDPNGYTIDNRKEFAPLSIIRDYLEKKGGAEQFGFFNIDEWKDLTPEQVEDFLEDIDYMFQKAKKRNQEKD